MMSFAVQSNRFYAQITLSPSGDKLRLYSRFEDRETAKAIPGRQWNPVEKCWEYPLRGETLTALLKAFPGAKVDPKVRVALAEIAEREAITTHIKQIGWENVESVSYDFKTAPFAHQVAAMKTVLTIWGFKEASKKEGDAVKPCSHGGGAMLLMEQGT
jgi:hypothetical protein